MQAGLAVTKLGTSSIVYRIGLFQGDSDEPAAIGRFVHVYVDAATRAGHADPRGDPRAPVTPLRHSLTASSTGVLHRIDA